MTNSQQRLSLLQGIYREFQDFLTFRYDAQNQSIGLRIGKPILYKKIEQIPDHVLKNTKFNYEEVKWFKFNGINPSQRQLLVKFRYRRKHWEDALLGQVLIYDNAADVDAGINLEVENKVIQVRPSIQQINADWAAGLLGYFSSIFDLIGGTLNWLFTGNFITITNTILNESAIFVHILNSVDQVNLKEAIIEVNDLNQNGFIYLDKTDYDEKGLWLIFKLDYSRLDIIINRLENWVACLKR